LREHKPIPFTNGENHIEVTLPAKNAASRYIKMIAFITCIAFVNTHGKTYLKRKENEDNVNV